MQKNLLISFCSLVFLLPNAVSAATISLQSDPLNIGAGDTVRVEVLLNSAVPTNAFSGTVSYSQKKLEPLAISDGNSIVSMWITHPVVPATSREVISFAGITPGGFSGDKGILFSILFKAKEAGIADVSLMDVEVLRNDGVGGKEPVTMRRLALSIGPKSVGGYIEPADRTPPEPFTIHLGTDPQLFNGKLYLSFVAVDKGSGVDHYAVSESRLPSFLFHFFPPHWNILSESPYTLSDQNQTSTVYVRAVDRSGNEQISIYPPAHLFTAYENIVLLAILIGVVLLSRVRWEGRFRKKI